MNRAYKIIWLLISLSLATTTARADEFVRAKKDYSSFATGQEAADQFAAEYCKSGQYTRDCSAEYTGESWVSYEWRWHVTYSYTHTSGVRVTGQTTSGPITYGCPFGWVAYKLKEGTGLCTRPDQPAPPCDVCDGRVAPKVGNPILLGGGVKQQTETDYTNQSGSLEFTRTYRSDQKRWLHNYSMFAIDANSTAPANFPASACYYGLNTSTGKNWCFPYAGKGGPQNFILRRGAGRLTYFGTATDYSPPKDINDRVQPLYDETGSLAYWRVTNTSKNTVEVYSLTGHIHRVIDANGLETKFAYSDATTPIEVAPNIGLLIAVEDHAGRELKFSYYSNGAMKTLRDPEGNVFTYEYDLNGNLTKVTYPDGKFRNYVYNELTNTSNTPKLNMLTGIIDENQSRFATFSYYADDQALSTEHAGGVEKYSVTYPSPWTVKAVDPLGTERTYSMVSVLGVLKNTSVSQPNANGTAKISAPRSYDANGNLAQFTDFNEQITAYTYDLIRNLETKRVVGSGTPLALTTSTEWHADMRLPTRIAEPKRLTTFTYDSHGSILTKSVQATADASGAAGFTAVLLGSPRIWTYTYTALGQLATVQGPRTDVSELVSYTYDELANLISVTNAAGQTTKLSNYDVHGRVGRITDPNGLVTDLTYTVRGWLSSVSRGAETTTYDYDGVGQMTKATLPDGSHIAYAYDAAHRLIGIADAEGNSIIYTLDNMGNRIGEKVKDANSVLAREITRAYDPLNRLKQITGALQ